jgi:hypothetical protein
MAFVRVSIRVEVVVPDIHPDEPEPDSELEEDEEVVDLVPDEPEPEEEPGEDDEPESEEDEEMPESEEEEDVWELPEPEEEPQPENNPSSLWTRRRWTTSAAGRNSGTGQWKPGRGGPARGSEARAASPQPDTEADGLRRQDPRRCHKKEHLCMDACSHRVEQFIAFLFASRRARGRSSPR